MRVLKPKGAKTQYEIEDLLHKEMEVPVGPGVIPVRAVAGHFMSSSLGMERIRLQGNSTSNLSVIGGDWTPYVLHGVTPQHLSQKARDNNVNSMRHN